MPRITLIEAIHHEPDAGQQQRYDSRSNYHEKAAPPPGRQGELQERQYQQSSENEEERPRCA